MIRFFLNSRCKLFVLGSLRVVYFLYCGFEITMTHGVNVSFRIYAFFKVFSKYEHMIIFPSICTIQI